MSPTCLRCSYDLRGIADEQPCPECGLLAERSRRKTEQLRDARPRWLLSLSAGVWIVLLALVSILAWGAFVPQLFRLTRRWLNAMPYSTYLWANQVIWYGGYLIAGTLLVIGIFLLTRPEGYEPADQADQRRRRWIRLFSFSVLVGGLVLGGGQGYEAYRRYYVYDSRIGPAYGVAMGILLLGMALLFVVGFEQFRSLAKRAGSAHLFEHCRIVGVGMAITLVLALPFAIFARYSEQMGIDYNTTARSILWRGVVVVMATTVVLFWFWTIYVLIRFAISFARASLAARRMWRESDRAAVGG